MKKSFLFQLFAIAISLNMGACAHEHEEGEGHAENNGHVHNNGTNNGANNGAVNNGGTNNGEVQADALAVAACGMLDGDAAPVTAASSEEALAGEALQAGSPQVVTLPPGGAGFLIFTVEEEHQDWSFSFREAGVTGRLTTPEGVTLELTGAANLSCGDMIMLDARQHLDLMGEYVLELNGEGGAEVWVLALSGASAHSPEEGNNGHMHEEEGMHDHDG